MKQRKSHKKAKETLLKIIDEDYEVYVSEDMISTIYYILKRKSKSSSFFKKVS